MKPIEDFFSETQIIKSICKIRVKLAKSRSKKHLLNYLTKNSKYNYHQSIKPTNELEKLQFEIDKQLKKILPPRKKWKEPLLPIIDNQSRKIIKRRVFNNSSDRNFYSLLNTIKYHKNINSQETWLLNLTEFVTEIRDILIDKKYTLTSPIIIPKLKNEKRQKEGNECRPICMFNLKDRIVLSIVNKFLTYLFDSAFENTSYAFRIKKNSEGKNLSHHDCIRDILKYKEQYNNEQLFIVECDMQKFYDTVNHNIIKEEFNTLISETKKHYPNLDLDLVINIFYSYLECFCFNKDVPKKEELDYWESYKIPNGFFGWINEKELSDCGININRERMGVPQGGALSGLIANIYLNKVDKKLMIFKDIFYARFCDDMIIISPSQEECEKAKEVYLSTLSKELKLFPHLFKNNEELINIRSNKKSYKPFWEGKSKGVYLWGCEENNKLSFPWIGFVGYEINYKGEVRVRKKSLQKELKKQRTIVEEIKKAVSKGQRCSKYTIIESAINRLIGMSVGRVKMYNYDKVPANLCWKNGFKELTLNKYSLKQLKQLDRSRNKLYYRLFKDIDEKKSKSKTKRVPNKYNKPFSYYYQVLERKKSNSNNYS
ncbi:group II intron reverse transcriptase domain-containing protein [Capnocytophaga genosp. AHN8471]|jgi:hypothetical protein|uniref:Group II intron reverse transcriptase domain-containing protein n=1 Tax=Capnocytophaga genosp. AHN8471 TaxID=327574 RepID=A0ABS1YSX2_9FLAO|nr:reverse transcriptase/maturase family protein [Capnocytophaga genosp. AHN8471]MBM0649507.1 group II intron reverse transcriptase domain-containing protein [Capnocytophaga genosp. AHN8471]MBM0661147.1 group II intron reverse transcriptase domain-containing protein [Capnocytophaga genosp. AHN8471]